MEPIAITLVPHTHWDREWYAPFSELSPRLVTMMDTLLELADAGFPHFHLDGQTAMIDDYLAVRPEREADIRRHVAEGRISAGPWVTQMDEFLTSGESHIRNLEMGLERARELGGALEVGYMPDQFGHIGQMPQILRSCGIERAVVWRGVPRAIDRDAFRWQAPDGSTVLTEYMAFGYFNGEPYHRVTDPGELATAVERTVERGRPFMASDRMLVMVGYDHAGPDATLPDRLAAASPHLRGTVLRIGGIGPHLADQRPSGEPPVWRGELRSSARAHLLPNVYSARVHQKRERGRVEALLERYAEPLAALVPGFEWPEELLLRAWTLLLWNGAHDSACGCSHDQVARDVDARFAEARSITEGIVDAALTALGAQVAEPGIVRFNPSPFERDGVPGLGWRVDPTGPEPPEAPVPVEIRGGWLEAGGIAFTLREEPDVGDLYNFCYAEQGQVASPPDRLAVDAHGIVAVWDGLEVRLRALRRDSEPFVRLRGEIRNVRPDHRLRLHVMLPEVATGSVAGSPFELVERPLVGEGGDVEAPSSTWPARGVVLAGGVAAYHEGVFEYETSARELALALLRCVGTISRPQLATRPWSAGPGVPTPDAQMLGATGFEIGLRAGASREDALVEWECFALAVRSAGASGGGTLPARGRLLELDGDAVLSSINRARGTLRVRVWNPWTDRPALVRIGERSDELGPARIETIALA